MSTGMSFSKNQLSVPEGFPSLLEKLAMEVLRNQPKNIVQFAADYLNQLLKERESDGVSHFSTSAAAPVMNNEPKPDASIQMKKESGAASKIQRNYRQHYMRRCESATIIQASYRGYRIRKSLRAENKRDTRDLPPMADHARLETSAIKIQASFRGHQARKSLRNGNEGETQPLPHDEELEAAATKLQASFRGFQTRKALQNSNRNDSQHAANKDQLEMSATKIQASYKGYRVRKEVKQRELEVKAFLNEAEDAAIIIQKNYRGYCTRRNMKK